MVPVAVTLYSPGLLPRVRVVDARPSLPVVALPVEREAPVAPLGWVVMLKAIATLATQTSFTLTAGSADDDAYKGCMIVITDQATSTQKAVGVISAYTGGSKTVTLKDDPAVFTMAATDTVDILA
ncbi:hypothetical protein LCGC14_2733240, partial [marine sediment metagenome]